MIKLEAYTRVRRQTRPSTYDFYTDHYFKYEINCGGKTRYGDKQLSTFPGQSYSMLRYDAMHGLADSLRDVLDEVESEYDPFAEIVIEPIAKRLMTITSDTSPAKAPSNIRPRLKSVDVGKYDFNDMIDDGSIETYYLEDVVPEALDLPEDTLNKALDMLRDVPIYVVSAEVDTDEVVIDEFSSLTLDTPCGERVTLKGQFVEYILFKGEITVATMDEQAARQLAERLARLTGISADKRLKLIYEMYEYVREAFLTDPEEGYDEGIMLLTDEAYHGIKATLPCSQLPNIDKFDCQ